MIKFKFYVDNIKIRNQNYNVILDVHMCDVHMYVRIHDRGKLNINNYKAI